MALDARTFLGADCNDDGPRGCDAPATYLVLDGECPLLACDRHLLDAIEIVIATSYLTVDSDPLGLVRLSETELD